MCSSSFTLEGLEWNGFDGTPSSSAAEALGYPGYYPGGVVGWDFFDIHENLCGHGFPNCAEFKPTEFKPVFGDRTIEEVPNPVLPLVQWRECDPGPMVKPFPSPFPTFSFAPSVAGTDTTAELFSELPLSPPPFIPTPTIHHPQSVQPHISPCPSSTISPHTILHHHHHHHHASDHRRKRKDPRETSEHNKLLVRWRAQGVSYKTIRERLGLSEAESTLRGRLRTLTKPKNERLRQPIWLDEDIEYLLRAVTPGRPPKWKSISEAIVALGGSYKFGPSTCKKQYLKLVAEGRAEPLVGCLPKRRASRG